MLQHVRKEIEWMIRNSLHREALHGLWVSFGLALRANMGYGEVAKHRWASALAQSWLRRANWRDGGLTSKERQLGEHVKHVLRPMDAVD